MSRCVQFHHLYDKDAEACGMSPVSESYYKRYREAVRKLANQKLDEDMIYDAFKEGAYRVILSIKSEDTRTDALSYVSECLHNGEKVTDRDLRGWLKVWRIEHGEPIPEKLTNVNSPPPVSDVKPEVPIKSLGERVRAQEMATATENQPKDPTFKTGNEIKMGLMAPPRPEKPEDPLKILKENRVYAEKLLECYSERTQLMVKDLMRDHASWKSAADVFYFGIECLAERKK